MVAKNSGDNKFLIYKGKPLVRCKNTMYYGDITDKYITKIQIKNTKPLQDLEIANLVSVQLISTDPNLNSRKKIIKTSEKDSLYLAIDIAEIWLSRALRESNVSQ